MKNAFILILLGLTLSNCFTYQKIQNKKENLAKLDKIFQSLEFKVSIDGGCCDIPSADIKFAYEPDSIYLQNKITFSGRYENRITQSKLETLKKRIIKPFTKKEIDKAFEAKKNTGYADQYKGDYQIFVSNDTLKATFPSNGYTFVEICKMLKKEN